MHGNGEGQIAAGAVLPDAWQDAIVERLAPFEPVSVYVFGSRARGDAREDSDVDLLVVLRDLADDWETTEELGVSQEATVWGLFNLSLASTPVEGRM